MAGFYLLIEVWGRKRWAFPLVVIGMNSIAAYCMAPLCGNFIGQSLRTHLGANAFRLFGRAYEPLVHGALVAAGDVAAALLDVPPQALSAHLKEPVASDERLRSWQLRIFGLLWGAYASYYLCRVNFAVAQPLILREFPAWTSAQIGSIPSAYAVAYAAGQIVNGTLGERYGARRLMTGALLIAAVSNVLFAFASSLNAMRVLVGD